MDSVGIRALRQNLSVYLRRVAAGESLRVTDHGRAVALLGPLPAPDDPLAELVAAGKVRPATRSLADLPLPLPPLRDGPSVSEVLRALRDEEDR